MLNAYIPTDRRHALARGEVLADRQHGAALFADIAGFTPLAEAMEKALGAQRGAEELTALVNRIFDALVDAVDRYRGSIVAFAGDAMTCWFDGDDGTAALASALAMQSAMASVGKVSIPGVEARSVGLKVAVSVGQARRFEVGDPAIQRLDVLAGAVVDRLGEGDKAGRTGEVLLDARLVRPLEKAIVVDDIRGSFVRVAALKAAVRERRWPILEDDRIAPQSLRSWVLGPVYERLQSGQSRFLAEFRPVAALFVSFEGIDYELPDAGRSLDAVIRGVQEVVARHGGSVFDVSTGDKGSYLLAVFGAPVGMGDDIRRAVAAAGELREKGSGRLRIGVNAGRVYAGLYAGRARSAYRVAGDAVNLAARLMMAARPGQVLMSGAIGAALDRRFSIQALEPIAVKGRVAPVAVCELAGAAAASIGLSEPRYALPLIGRESHLHAIGEALNCAKAGRGTVLGLRGEAGMGKSRLVHAALQRAGAEGFAVFGGECQPHGAGIAYLPWRTIWNALLGLAADGSVAERRSALAANLAAAAPELVPLAPLLDRVLDLPMEDSDVTRGMPAPARKQALEQILAGSMRARAAMGPLCIVLEDLHWVDSLSRDLLGALAGAIHDRPVLFVLAYRPAEASERPLLAGLNELELDELSHAEASRLAEMLLAHVTGKTAEAAPVAVIVERANGNPFYIEELVRYVSERGGATSDLPASLESLILSRIDRLSKSQQLAVKVASVIGRRFPVGWLAGAYSGTLGADLAQDLQAIRSAALIVDDTPPPEEAYLFRHAVVRDVAYETLGFALRQGLHEQLASHLEASDGNGSVDLLAYHYARSANTAKEAHYRRLAAELAVRNGAYADALAHVQRASEIVAGQPQGPRRLEQELELQLLLGTILLVVDGQGSARAKAAYDRARELSRAVPPGPAAGRAIFGLWTYYLFQGWIGPTEELADEAVALAAMSPDPSLRIMAHLAVCQTHMWTGKWRKCVDHYEHVLALYDPTQHQAYVTQYAQNPRFTASNSGFWGEWMLGNPQRAAAVAEAAITEAAALNHDFTYVIAFAGRPMVAYFRRLNDFMSHTDEYVERARRAGNPFYIAMALSLDACAKIVGGRHDEGLEQLEAQDRAMQALGSKLIDPLVVSFLAEGYLAGGRYEQGIALIDARCEAFAREGRISWTPDHLRLRSELQLALDPARVDEPLARLQRGIEIAREHGAKAFELRAALAAASVLERAGHSEDARRLVAPVYARFTEGFDDPDLRTARKHLS